MMSIIALAFFFYFFCLSMFSLIRHPVYYCVLLVLKSLFCSFISYSVYGFRWYSLLFCLVYVGGVYILFIFVSVHRPNRSVVSYWGVKVLWLLFFGLLVVLVGSVVCYVSISFEFRRFLCRRAEGPFYICMCLTLLFGFLILRILMSVKLNHYR